MTKATPFCLAYRLTIMAPGHLQLAVASHS